jgi:hypothetical protein
VYQSYFASFVEALPKQKNSSYRLFSPDDENKLIGEIILGKTGIKCVGRIGKFLKRRT